MRRAFQLLPACLLWLLVLPAAVAQPRCNVATYSDFNDGALNVGSMVQDGRGLLWVGTRNGLYRYDGYQFKTFKSQPGDGTNMPSSRISKMYCSATGSLWCLIDHRAFLFDTYNYRFIDVLAPLENQRQQSFEINKIRSLDNGQTWLVCADSTILGVDDVHASQSAWVAIDHCDTGTPTVMADDDGRSWLLTNDTAYVFEGHRRTAFAQRLSQVCSCGGQTWLLRQDGTLMRYDSGRRQVMLFSGQAPKDSITSVVRLSDRLMALITPTRLYMFDARSQQLWPTDISASVRKLSADSRGALWIVTADGQLLTADSLGRQARTVPGVLLDNYVMHEDQKGTVWFFSEKQEVFYSGATRQEVVRYEGLQPLGKLSSTIRDNQGGFWSIASGQREANEARLLHVSFGEETVHRLDITPQSEVRGTLHDSKNRLWVPGRDDNTLRIYDSRGALAGFLGPDGRLHTEYTQLGMSIFCLCEDSRGTIWMAGKRDGLLRLRPKADGSFDISQYRQGDNGLNENEIYDIMEDHRHRLWIATHRGGPNCIEHPEEDTPRFLTPDNGLAGWKEGYSRMMTRIMETRDHHLLLATAGGLYVGDATASDIRTMVFNQHLREPNRRESLSSIALTDLLQTSSGRIFVGTEGGGLNEITSADLMAPVLSFRHYDTTTGFPSDLALAVVEHDSSLWVTSPDQLVEMSLTDSSSRGVNSYLGKEQMLFTVARPTPVNDGLWLFGLKDGAATVDLNDLRTNLFVPPIVCTAISIEGMPTDYSACSRDTFVLAPGQRNLMLSFAALDYNAPEDICYAYRLGDDSRPWTFLGNSHTISLADLRPGVYTLTVCSTNSDGIWTQNERTFVLDVQPTFWETPWAVLLIIILVLAVGTIAAYTLLYIRRIKRQQHETMEKYLALVEKQASTSIIAEENTPTQSLSESSVGHSAVEKTEEGMETAEEDNESEAFMQTFATFIEKNLGNSDVTIDDIASVCAVSRTSLHRKVKHLMGMSPMEFLREARQRKAMSLLRHTQKSVSEIAYACGFTDPKYFSKCFKTATGLTPKEYRQEQER